MVKGCLPPEPISKSFYQQEREPINPKFDRTNILFSSMTMKLNISSFFFALTVLSACQAQPKAKPKTTENLVTGDTVAALGNNIMVIYQDKQDVYWFGSWETGVYRYDGKTLVNYTTRHGLQDNRIDEVKEDESGNIYFLSCNSKSNISRFDGLNFTIIPATPSTDWQLNSTDIWFRHSFENEQLVYRFDGTTLHELYLPNPPNLPNPFGIYCIYTDRKGNLWFGTNPVGVCRYDGNGFDWITEEDVTEFRDEGANGVRSIAEDRHGDFWFNTEYRYSIYDSTLANNQFYARHESIGGLDGQPDSQLDEYLSTVRDDNDNLWFVTYRDGVWKYDGEEITHYIVQDNSVDITLFSIYKDNNGDLWLGTHANGVYQFNGSSFEKFVP